MQQTDDNWKLIIVDDCSPSPGAVDYLRTLQALAPGKIELVLLDRHAGPGSARNAGVRRAFEHRHPIILFQDADDLSDRKRLEVVRDVMSADSQVTFVYSAFSPIDEDGNAIRPSDLTGSIQEILEAYGRAPHGPNAWLDIGVRTGYATLTSTTSVATDVIYSYPFPAERISEDAHAWFRCGAGGGNTWFASEIRGAYRIPRKVAGSASRARQGRERFYSEKCRVDNDGFVRGIELALANGKISCVIREELLVRFHIRLAKTMLRAQQAGLASLQLEAANAINPELCAALERDSDYV